ncbi:putative protein N(5)-glutamine methyltransferase [Amnibacterium flavum]|uniref:peptide chain release factor N(5)-glutamine methyltransferase n=1 Tax=Amnibacterium flavum TaxID=2173173 RepID=A0A2V1HVC3_9MICO|nr:putative protein N(5)-glutamine methyltransferase [Amnibacterium flavum]PVZ94287.1 putative protein N(5)-glutamine methyltransferase [Amnibacterium flavum]
MTDPTLVARLRAAGCVFAEDEAELITAEATSAAQLESLVRRRIGGEPLEQVLGWAAFDGLRIAVEPGVFVPRRRTELLVREAAAILSEGDTVLDLCCGSGAVAAAVHARVPGVAVFAADIDPAAVHCARRNVPGPGAVFEGDLYSALPRELMGRVDVIAVNAPYVPTEAIDLMPPEARLHEPTVALDGGEDGLDIQRRVAEQAPEWLAPGGDLLIETSRRQAPVTVEIMETCGLVARIVRSEDIDATIVIGSVAR